MTMNAGNPAAEAVGSAAATTVDDQSQIDTTDTELQQDAEGQEADPKGQTDDLTDEELAALGEGDDFEVEHQGQKLKVPKALKPLVMMQQDYTRKTQDLAESRRSFETERARHTELVQAVSKTTQERAQRAAIELQYKQLQDHDAEFDKVDWNALILSQNPEDQVKLNQLRYNREQLQQQMRRLAGQHAELGQTIQKTEAEHIAAQRADFAKRQAETRKVIEKDIPGWSLDRDARMVEGAQEFYGLSIEQLRTASADPTLYRVVWDAVQLRQILKARASKPKPKPVETAEPQPAAKVSKGGPSGPAGLHDKLPIDEWMKRANAKPGR